MSLPINFTLHGGDFYKRLNKLRFVKSDKLIILGHKNNLYAGFQEPEAIAWINCGPNIKKDFSAIAINNAAFMGICKHQQQLEFKGDSKLDAIATDKKLSISNIPIETWQPDIEYLNFKSKDLGNHYSKFLKILKVPLRLASSLDGGIKSIQISYQKNELLIAAVLPTGSLGYICRWVLDKNWVKVIEEINLQTWLLPVEAVQALLDDDSNILYVRDDKIAVYNADFHIVFSQFGDIKPASTFDTLLKANQDIEVRLDYNKMFELLNTTPPGQTVELISGEDKRQLDVEIAGFARVKVGIPAKRMEGKANKIVLNYRQFRQLISICKLFEGSLSWSHFIKITCPVKYLEHNWLLGSTYVESTDDG